MECEELKKDEIEALQAIYSNELTSTPNSVSIELVSEHDSKKCFVVCLTFELPTGYPVNLDPRIIISAPWMSADEKRAFLKQLDEQIVENKGQQMVYTLVEFARGELDILVNGKLEDEQSRLSPEVAATEESKKAASLNVPYFHGENIVDRKSTFQAHLARVKSLEEVQDVIENLQSIRKISLATHNMWAYRIVDGPVIREDCDDDGETHAGSRLLHLLNIVDAQNVLVVVSRWYGGIQLGPDRFKHINNAARDILVAHGCINK